MREDRNKNKVVSPPKKNDTTKKERPQLSEDLKQSLDQIEREERARRQKEKGG